MGLDLQTASAIKILRIRQSKMAAAAILKIWKNAISPPQKNDFDEIWYSDAYCPSEHRQPIKFCKFNNSRWRRPPS